MTNWMIDDTHLTMPWDELDAVVFDISGVLLSYSPEEELEDLFPNQPELHARLTDKIIKSPYWCMMDRDTLTLMEAAEHMIGRDEDLRAPILRFMQSWLNYVRPIEEGVNAVKTCKAHGKKVYVLSNYQKASFDTMEKTHAFFDLFDGKVISARERLVKPNADIYNFLIEKYHLVPERTLFIDDTPGNIEGCMAVGWQGFCLNRPGKLEAFLK